jgi:hypothetical protein
MRNELEIKIGSTVYDKINTVRMSDSERQIAINAMRDAEAIADLVIWVARKIEQLGARLFLKPGLKH